MSGLPTTSFWKEIKCHGHVAVGCKYGVSDNAVRKWVRFYEKQMEREAVEVRQIPSVEA